MKCSIVPDFRLQAYAAALRSLTQHSDVARSRDLHLDMDPVLDVDLMTWAL